MNFAVGLARCPGTCGEWVQGARKGVPFLIDCPINRFSEAKVTLNIPSSDWVLPLRKTKARQMLNLLAKDLGISELGGEVEFLQQLPEGKGMASSTADIIAVASAALIALKEDFSPERLARYALRIEPSDSVMFPGITEIEHVQRHHYRTLGSSVPALFLALDWGGAIDTRAFNARPDLAEHYRHTETEIKKAYDLACEGIERADLEKLALAGTISATCNLEINPKLYFKPFLDWVRQNGGVGVVTAHSGTLLAGVFSPDDFSDPKFRQKLKLEAQQRFAPAYLDLLTSHSGGITAAKLKRSENVG